MNIRKKHLLVLFCVGGLLISGHASDGDLKVEFEKRYGAWKAWVGDHAYMSDFTSNREFAAIVELGPPVLPYLVDRMEGNPEDFHLEVAVYLISKRRFRKDQWPAGKLGNASVAAKMYVRWWKEDRFKTGERFGELYGKWRALKSERKDLEAEAVYREIVDLGIPVLPYLEGKVGRHPEFVPAMSRLSGKALSKTASPAECRAWWAENRKRFELPPRASGNAPEK